MIADEGGTAFSCVTGCAAGHEGLFRIGDFTQRGNRYKISAFYSGGKDSNVYMTEKFEEIYRQNVQAVYRFALSCVGREQVAEDITSETFLALLRNMDGLDVTQLQGWLITVARNRARDYWRRHATENKYLSEFGDAIASVPANTENWLLDIPDLKSVHRLCITLRYVEGMSRLEIAETMGLSETQVKGHLQYGLHLLRKALSVREEK